MEQRAEPCLVVIFGATGDLTREKLLPALHNLGIKDVLPERFALVGVARRQKTHDAFRKEVAGNDRRCAELAAHAYYHQTEFEDDAGFRRLRTFLALLAKKHRTRGNVLFYLATSPEFFGGIAGRLRKHGFIGGKGWQRVVFEKPFGHDLRSAEELNRSICRHFPESSVYRIDHYLGKDAVQNLLTVRFANGIFEALWNNRYIDHVQMTSAEDKGVGMRGGYYDDTGALRDMVQNHMLQMLVFIAMEAPKNLSAKAIHDAKAAVLRDVHIPTPAYVRRNVVRAQYTTGKTREGLVPGYRQEELVPGHSQTETFVALKLAINNKRWKGVPFYLRTGKRLPERVAEIRIQFRRVPHNLFGSGAAKDNSLLIRIQPEAGVSLRFNIKSPESSTGIQPVQMDFSHDSVLGQSPEAYERLLHDAMAGDSTLFTRWDEVRRSWMIVDPILRAWKRGSGRLLHYRAGTWGPKEAEKLIVRDSRRWTER